MSKVKILKKVIPIEEVERWLKARSKVKAKPIEPSSKTAMSDKAKAKLVREEAARKSFKRSQELKKGSLPQLKDEYNNLKPNAQRAERLKGSESKFLKVFKDKGMKELKAGGSMKGKPVNGIKGTQVAKANWLSGLSKAEKAAILGLTTRGAGGMRKHSKKKQKPTKVRKANLGGMTGEGLYPAEEARSGIMSQVRRKKYMKKGGKVISYKMTGGQVVGAGYD